MNVQVSASPTVQAVLDAAAAAIGDLGDGWVLLDGIDSEQGLAAKSLTVGGTWDPELNSLTTDNTVQVQSVESGAGRRVTETTAISCLVYASAGSLDFPALRGEVNAALTAFREQLRAITAADGLPARAQITDQQWAQVLDQAGAGVMALCTVTVRVLP